MQLIDMRRWNASLLSLALTASSLLASGAGARAQILNLDFAGSGYMYGAAAVGDYYDCWNVVSPDGTQQTITSGLWWGDYVESPIEVVVQNGPHGGTPSTWLHPLLNTFTHSSANQTITINLMNVPPGQYDVVLYGRGDGDDQNAYFHVTMYGHGFGVQWTSTTPEEWMEETWPEGDHHVVYRDVLVSAGQPLVVAVAQGDGGFPLINGLQLVTKSLSGTSDADGDGLLDTHEVMLGTNPYSRDTDGDGIADGTEVVRGSDPLTNDGIAGAGLAQLRVFTPLQ
jgi:uncharacterized protein (DUF2141 family)